MRLNVKWNWMIFVCARRSAPVLSICYETLLKWRCRDWTFSVQSTEPPNLVRKRDGRSNTHLYLTYQIRLGNKFSIMLLSYQYQNGWRAFGCLFPFELRHWSHQDMFVVMPLEIYQIKELNHATFKKHVLPHGERPFGTWDPRKLLWVRVDIIGYQAASSTHKFNGWRWHHLEKMPS